MKPILEPDDDILVSPGRSGSIAGTVEEGNSGGVATPKPSGRDLLHTSATPAPSDSISREREAAPLTPPADEPVGGAGSAPAIAPAAPAAAAATLQSAADQPFAAIALQYARDVTAGRIPACKWTRLACQRHIDDLARAAVGEEWPYVFNPQLAERPQLDKEGKIRPGRRYRPVERICKFAQLMPHIKGVWAANEQRIRLEPWQVFILASLFGWVRVEQHKAPEKLEPVAVETDDDATRAAKATARAAKVAAAGDLGLCGLRRFRVADLYVPRKNAKSTLAAIIGLYCLAVDGEYGAEVYSGATSEDQAYEVFRPARLMAAGTPEFQQHYAVTVNISNLAIIGNNSKMEPVIGKPGDGASPSCAIVDEYHEHKTPALYETMETGMGARSQPLLLVITTAGSDISGPCYQHQVELQKVLEGVVENDRRFGIIYGIDEGDDWTDPQVLRKANPNFGVSVDAEFLEAQQQDAITNPRKQNVFKTKHLNVWVAAASPWLNLYNLQKAGDPTLRPEQFAGDVCVAGLDLASKVDIASRVLVFKRGEGDEAHYYAFSRNYIPQTALEKVENAHYQAWEKKGYLTATPGNMISLATIEEDLMDDAESVPISEVAFDAWGAREMAPNLQEEGFTVVDIPMQVRHLSEPMKTIAAALDGGRFHHDGNEAFVWMMSNVEVAPDRNENWFPRKQRPENKIDAAVALIVAMARAAVAKSSAGFGVIALD